MFAFANYLWRLVPANPILLRVVEAGGKRTRDLIIRCVYLGLLVGLVLVAMLSGTATGSAADLSALAKTSSGIFQQMSYLQLGLVALLAPIFTAGAITQEKDSQTYDILLSTPLTNGQIILGSLLSRLFFIVALLVSGIPIFSITQIFGGVAIRSIAQSFGIAAATAFVTGALAMAIATFKVGTRRTIFSFYLFIVAYLASGIMLDQFARFHPILGVDPTHQNAPLVCQTSWFTALNPFLALRTLFKDPNYTPPVFETLPESLRRWPIGWLLSDPASFYTALMFTLSFLLVTPSILLIRRIAQATQTDKPIYRLAMGIASAAAALAALFFGPPDYSLYAAGLLAAASAGLLAPWIRDGVIPFLHRKKDDDLAATGPGGRRIGRAPRSRKPRAVWNNPIAWREAKSKASASRGGILRYAFMAAGIIGAVFLVYRYARVPRAGLTVDPSDYDPIAVRLTVGRQTYELPTFDPNQDYPVQVAAAATTDPADAQFVPLNPADLHVPLEVVPGSLQSAPAANGSAQRVITGLRLRPVSRLISAVDARRYLLGFCAIEFAVILLIVTNAAASTVTREKEDGTLDLLLSSPITSRYYVWGKLRGLVSFVLPLLAVPTVSVLLFVVYDLFQVATGRVGPDYQWIVLPEAVVLLPAMLIIVSAFAAILGMLMSLRCRTTVMAVMSSVGIVVGICAAMGWCGFSLLKSGQASGADKAQVAIGSFSPFTLMQMLIDPWGSLSLTSDNAAADRTLMCVCTVIAVASYAAIVWSMYKSMVKNFDMTIRKQSR